MNDQQIMIKKEERSIDLYYEGMEKRNSGFTKSAIRCFNEAINLAPNNFLYYVQRGFSKRTLGQFDDAIEDFEQAILLCQQQNRLYSHIPPLRKARALIALERDRNRRR